MALSSFGLSKVNPYKKTFGKVYFHWDTNLYNEIFVLLINDEFLEILSPSSLLTMRAFMLDDVDFSHFDVDSTFFFLWK